MSNRIYNVKSNCDFQNIEDNSSESSGSEESGNEINEFSIEGCEAKGVTLLTPFNMKEELEEGYFDTEGMYHWKKRPEYSEDWLDNISNYNFKKVCVSHTSQSDKESSTSESHDCTEIFKKILNYLQPNESITQALCRLGRKNPLTTVKRLKLKKLGGSLDTESAQQITDLTGLVNIILTKTGDFDIYENTADDIQNKISQSISIDSSKAISWSVPKIDMFAEDYVEKD